jgi:hypothetical protein
VGEAGKEGRPRRLAAGRDSSTFANVTVITPTIPGREQVLARCLESVYNQTMPPIAHIVVAQQRATDEPRPVALAKAQNKALRAVTTEWVMRLADDDWLTPLALERLMCEQYIADVIYGYDKDKVAPMINVNGYSAVALAEFFHNCDTGQASGDLYRTRTLRAIGGWTTEFNGNHFHHPMSTYCLRTYEDAATRAVLAQAGARFRYVDFPTWIAGTNTPDRIGSTPAPLVPCG